MKELNGYWWTRVLPGDRGLPNYTIEVSHADHNMWLPVNYDTYMLIPLNENEIKDPESEKNVQGKD